MFIELEAKALPNVKPIFLSPSDSPICYYIRKRLIIGHTKPMYISLGTFYL